LKSPGKGWTLPRKPHVGTAEPAAKAARFNFDLAAFGTFSVGST
jgi:hypothetical protein